MEQPVSKQVSRSDRDARLAAVLRVCRDVSGRGAGISIREALRRVSYLAYRPMFKAGDLRALIAGEPALIEEWLAYSQDKRTLGGWYVLRNGEVGQVSNPQSRVTFESMEDAISEFVVRELDYWVEPDDFPHGWTKTISELFAESKASGCAVGPPET